MKNRFVEEAFKRSDRTLLALPAPSVADQIGAKKSEDYDDVD